MVPAAPIRESTLPPVLTARFRILVADDDAANRESMSKLLQDRGFHVALVTDGRMSGASGNVPAAIHITPEAIIGGPLARLRDGDVIRLDSHTGILEARVTEATLHALQHYDVVQPWGDAYDLGPNGEHMAHHRSFCRQFFERQPLFATHSGYWQGDGGPNVYPHSGYAWAMTREANAEAVSLLERAMTIDPRYAFATALCASH